MKRVFVFLVVASVFFEACSAQSTNANNPNDFEIEDYGTYIVINGYRGTSKSVVIPDRINGKVVTEIGVGAFSEKNLTGVTIPNGVTTIGDVAFAGNQLTSITIGKGVDLGTNSFGVAGRVVWNSSGFAEAYRMNGEQAGRYTRPDINSTNWTRR